eukprot:TRINITY_DN19361_c0_g1_i1.p1 TRINITY_DN19361_c0_g1~~TRINITY_DN19361_c0_g1_i1.p1  ORF type:complete len:132 (-),score=21.13 TRINITY_DN19361_c0_g1_i1:83-478(-)
MDHHNESPARSSPPSAARTTAHAITSSANGARPSSAWNEVNAHHFVVASSITSFFEAATLYPFDVIKTRQQVGYSGFRRVAADLWKRAGMRGLYKGFSWSVIGGVPSDVAFWLSYNVFKDAMLTHLSLIHI